MNKKEDLKNVIREVKQGGRVNTLAKIKNYFDSLKPYICPWSESSPEAEACYENGPLLLKPLVNLIEVDLIDNLLFLIPKAKNEEIDLAMELLKYYEYNFNYKICNEEQKQLFFYP